ncbi:MAG: cation-translocating P-type ATPase [Thermomicrobiales bacterium]
MALLVRDDQAAAAPFRQPVAAVATQFSTDPVRGLAAAEAQARLGRYGPNELAAVPPAPAWRRFLAQFQDMLVALLLLATAISIGLWVYERDTPLPYEGLAILAIVLINGVLGFVQEARAEQSLAALRAMTVTQAGVVRDGELRRIPASQLVPGDLIAIEEGDAIPADGRLVEVASLQTAEAALTGESLPVAKETARIAGEDVALGDQTNMVFSGTTATYGHGRAIVTATGMQTEMGRIAGLLQQTGREETPLQRELDRTGRILGLVVLVIAAVVVVAVVLVERVRTVDAFMEVLILGVALAVAAVPEGLAAIVTVTLALGVQRMARRNAIVRKLPAVETLGSATTIVSDKTGTLTRNEMTVRTIATASGRADFTGTGYAPAGDVLHNGQPLDSGPIHAEMRSLLRAADLANNATLREAAGRWSVQGDPTEGALLVAARKAGLTHDDLATRFSRVAEVPFSSERKLMSAVHRDGAREGRLRVFTKGAPDILLARCTHELLGEEAQPLTEARRVAIRATNETLAGESLRVLGAAFRTLPPESAPETVDEAAERELVFLGLIGMIDPARPEARDAVATAREAGIRALMITGDHPQTAAAIAAELGIAGEGARAVSGSELERLPDDELRRLAREVSVYARVNPEHKLRIVEALKREGAIVAMTGDGVNDAPALKKADIGVAMGITGTDVSKEAADIILTDDNFATIVAAIEEGRAIFANIRKFLRYLLSSNVGEVLTMFLAVVLGGALGLRDPAGGAVLLPLLAAQILWINLVTDGAPALALAVDPAAPDVMRRPPRAAGEGVLTARMWAGIAFVGLVTAAATLLVFDAALPGGLIAGNGDILHARTMAFTTLVLAQLFNVFNARSDTRSAFVGLFRNRWLWGAVALSLALQLLPLYAPPLQRAFATTALGLRDWLVCLAAASAVLWLREASKILARAWQARG